MLNDDHAVAMNLATREEMAFLKEQSLKINELMKDFFLKMNLKLVDFKLEFGKDSEGNIILADEISPDTCRLWDVNTNEKLDKERFRRDLGDLVRNLPGVQGILDWKKCGTDKFAVGDDGKKFTAEYGMGTITILIEDQQYIVKYTEDGSEWSEERKYDGQSKIETERTTNHTHGDIVRCVRDINNLEKVDVYLNISTFLLCHPERSEGSVCIYKCVYRFFVTSFLKMTRCVN